MNCKCSKEYICIKHCECNSTRTCLKHRPNYNYGYTNEKIKEILLTENITEKEYLNILKAKSLGTPMCFN